jgi:hypothetical protein
LSPTIANLSLPKPIAVKLDGSSLYVDHEDRFVDVEIYPASLTATNNPLP